MDIESNNDILEPKHENPNVEAIDLFDSDNDISEPEPKHENPPNAEVIDLETEQKVKDIYVAICVAKEKLEKSPFYSQIVEQMEHEEMVERIESVIATDPRYSRLQLVLYGLGRLNSEHRHMQFAFALLLRDKFKLVNDIEVYDPMHSAVERMAIEAFNCTCLTINEHCKRKVDRPTLFFMPHLPFYLFDNVLKANWGPANLKKILILGNAFSGFIESSVVESTTQIKYILSRPQMLCEVPLPGTVRIFIAKINLDQVYSEAFHGISWHFWNTKKKKPNPCTPPV